MSSLPPLVLTPEVNNHLKCSLLQSWQLSSPQEDGSAKYDKLVRKLGTPPLFTTLRTNPMAGRTHKDLLDVVKAEIAKNYNEKGWQEPCIYYHSVVKNLIVVDGRGPDLDLQKHDKQVVVDLACGMAVLRGADVFAQGIMGCPLGMSEEDAVSVYCDVNHTCLKGATKFQEGSMVFVGNGTARVSREKLFCSKESVSGVGISMTQPLFEAPCLTDLCSDLIFPQNLPSVVVGQTLDPKQGETILDMCASPGGKTVHIASLMAEKGRLVALDKSQAKIDKIKKNAENWNLNFIETYPFDARRSCTDSADLCGGPPYPPGMFDRILLDGPCSALGQRPSSNNQMSLKSLKSYPCLQRQLFQQAVKLLRPGGTLVYSTCTITMEENEELVLWALQTFSCLSLATMEPHLGNKGRACAGLSGEDRDKLQLFLPGCDDQISPGTDTIGFFIAKFLKSSS
ncbi:putative methyltransferase NSUN6 [Mizuhopecten yessoensis]|uniref:Methyltransferase NSUN6 n=1 Tax=Mizuhopecten yessoensis TaxID=6573 RepID=A0A210PIT3_MIZYE|nr:putative methyltransferase NSUN6 [Mizuhopecten yessoensis]OWF36336.1 methyltransferase NSUN6 [Mizuhopecten yessoensis]